MKYLFIQLTLFVCICSIGQSQEAIKEISNFGLNPGNLRMYIHENQTKTDKVKPLLIVLHGCSQTANDVAELTGWNKIADSNNFIVLYPQQKFLNNPQLCFNWFESEDQEKNKGENESIFEMITFIKQNYPIDTTQIFITGLSAGAAMSVVMCSVHPEIFKSAAIFAGGAYKIATNPFQGMKAMTGKIEPSKEELINLIQEQNPNFKGIYPILIIYQGKIDPIVNKINATILVEQWTGINNTDTIPDKIEKSFSGLKEITRKEFLDYQNQISVILYEIEGLGHRLLIQPGTAINEGGKTGVFGVDRGFHSTYQTAIDFNLIKQ